jgi:hypothetical protein
LRYISEGEQDFLPWLRAALREAQSFVAACPVDVQGLALLEREFVALLERGGEVTVVAPILPALLRRLQDRFVGRVTMVAESALPDARVGLVFNDASCQAFIGAVSLTSEGLSGTASGVLLDGVRDSASAAEIVSGVAFRARVTDVSCVRLEDLLQPVMDGLEATGRLIRSGSHNGIRTGLLDLDNLTSGRHTGQLWVLNGASGVGKSVLALDFARASAIHQGVPALWLTTRDPATMITERLLSAESRVPLHHMRSGSMSDDDWARLARRMGEIAGAPLSIAEITGASSVDEAAGEALRCQPAVRLLVIDCLADDADIQTLKALKELAGRTQTWIVAVAPTCPSPLELDEVQATAADLIMRVHRDDQWDKQSPRAGEADLIVTKFRQGPTATITVAFQGHYSRFVD